ncbi:MAG: YfiR family protein [Sterolibacterium sp.]|nr:YfiR family protein [Sterolibacterium sp.]
MAFLIRVFNALAVPGWCRYGLLLSALLGGAGNTLGEDSAPEAALKAAFIFNFTRFVEWPEVAPVSAPAPAGRFQLCTVGGGATAEALAVFEGKQAAGRMIHVASSVRGAALRGCQLIFVSESVHDLSEILAEVRHLPVLTIGEGAGFISQGGLIALVREGGRLRFEVGLANAQGSGLKVGAPLLRLAKTVWNAR